jgi:hypothetical protein
MSHLIFTLFWVDGGDIIGAWFVGIRDVLPGGSSGLTEVEFIFRSYSCCRHSSIIIIDNYSTTVLQHLAC